VYGKAGPLDIADATADFKKSMEVTQISGLRVQRQQWGAIVILISIEVDSRFMLPCQMEVPNR